MPVTRDTPDLYLAPYHLVDQNIRIDVGFGPFRHSTDVVIPDLDRAEVDTLERTRAFMLRHHPDKIDHALEGLNAVLDRGRADLETLKQAFVDERSAIDRELVSRALDLLTFLVRRSVELRVLDRPISKDTAGLRFAAAHEPAMKGISLTVSFGAFVHPTLHGTGDIDPSLVNTPEKALSFLREFHADGIDQQIKGLNDIIVDAREHLARLAPMGNEPPVLDGIVVSEALRAFASLLDTARQRLERRPAAA